MSPRFREGMASKEVPRARKEQLAAFTKGAEIKSTKGSATLGVFMPFYTLGLLIFFLFTIFKVGLSLNNQTINQSTKLTPPQLVTKPEDEEFEAEGDERTNGSNSNTVSTARCPTGQVIRQKNFQSDREYSRKLIARDEKAGRSLLPSLTDNGEDQKLIESTDESTALHPDPDSAILSGECESISCFLI